MSTRPKMLSILRVVRPFRRIIDYVFPDGVQVGIISDDVFVVVALPDRDSWRMS